MSAKKRKNAKRKESAAGARHAGSEGNRKRWDAERVWTWSLSFGAVLLIGIAFTFATSAGTAGEFRAARVCFVLAAIASVVPVLVQLRLTPKLGGWRYVAGAISITALAAVAHRALAYVDLREVSSLTELVPGRLPTPEMNWA